MKHKAKIIIPVIVIVIVTVTALVFFLKLYPVAIIGDTLVTAKDLEYYQALALRVDSDSKKENAYIKLIENLKSQAVAKRLNVFPTVVQESQEKVFLTKGKHSDLPLSAEDFDRFVVRPAAIEVQLMVRFNQDIGLNKAEWDKTIELLSQIKSGKQFDDISKQESDDKVTGQFGGDMGFFEKGEILPELEAQIMRAELGQVYEQVAISRLGYHIIYLADTAEVDGVKKWHAKHILVQTSGFDEWYEKQVAKINVWQIRR